MQMLKTVSYRLQPFYDCRATYVLINRITQIRSVKGLTSLRWNEINFAMDASQFQWMSGIGEVFCLPNSTHRTSKPRGKLWNSSEEAQMVSPQKKYLVVHQYGQGEFRENHHNSQLNSSFRLHVLSPLKGYCGVKVKPRSLWAPDFSRLFALELRTSPSTIMGRPRKYHTPEEKRAADTAKAMRYHMK